MAALLPAKLRGQHACLLRLVVAAGCQETRRYSPGIDAEGGGNDREAGERGEAFHTARGLPIHPRAARADAWRKELSFVAGGGYSGAGFHESQSAGESCGDAGRGDSPARYRQQRQTDKIAQADPWELEQIRGDSDIFRRRASGCADYFPQREVG